METQDSNNFLTEDHSTKSGKRVNITKGANAFIVAEERIKADELDFISSIDYQKEYNYSEIVLRIKHACRLVNSPIRTYYLDKTILKERIMQYCKSLQSLTQQTESKLKLSFLTPDLDRVGEEDLDLELGCYAIVGHANFGKQLLTSYIIEKYLDGNKNAEVTLIQFNERNDVSISDKIKNGLIAKTSLVSRIKDKRLFGNMYDLINHIIDDNSDLIVINSLNSALYALPNGTLIKGGIDKEKLDMAFEMIQSLAQSLQKHIVVVYRASESEILNGITNIILGSTWGVLNPTFVTDRISDNLVSINLKGLRELKENKINVSKNAYLEALNHLNWRNL